MRRRISRLALRIAATAAALLCAALLIEWPRSYYRSDTVSVLPVTAVTHRGSLYLFTSTDLLRCESEAVTGKPAWPVMLLPIQPRTWREESILGFNAWIEDAFVLLQLPIGFVLPGLALLAACCHRRAAEITLKTNYLVCPACGYLLMGVVHWRCPECGAATQSRLVEALPAHAVSRPASRSRSRPGRVASPLRAPGSPTAGIRP